MRTYGASAIECSLRDSAPYFWQGCVALMVFTSPYVIQTATLAIG